jgi:hypothetical protein
VSLVTEPTDEVVRNMLLDAEIAVAVEGIKSWLPQWFLDLNDRHHAETQRLFDSGDLESAQVFADHGPCLDDGVVCAHREAEGGYPCAALRAVTGSAYVWTPMTDKWEAGWEEELDEFGTCGPSQQEGEDR